MTEPVLPAFSGNSRESQFNLGQRIVDSRVEPRSRIEQQYRHAALAKPVGRGSTAGSGSYNYRIPVGIVRHLGGSWKSAKPSGCGGPV